MEIQSQFQSLTDRPEVAMIIQLDREGSVAGLKQAIARVVSDDAVKSLMILSGDANGFSELELNPVLKNLNVPVCGGLFPAVIFGKEKLDRGSVVVGLTCDTIIETVPYISNDDIDHTDLIDEVFSADEDAKTVLVFVDGLASQIESFIDSLFTVFGLEPNYIGGGAGSLTMTRKPCLFTNQGMVKDAAVIALLPVASGIGVCHGWKSIGGPFRITESTGNVVHSIDWQPAFEVYSSLVNELSEVPVSREKFYETACAFPFGLSRFDAERVVRDPIQLNTDDSMVCVGDMPEGSFVDILHGDRESIISAAGIARCRGEAAFPANCTESARFFVDCISRAVFLGERFREELEAVYSEQSVMFGACTLGEIASSGRNFLEFYNKTSVIAILENI